jgi:DNA-binding Xre family transcriptional regulator
MAMPVVWNLKKWLVLERDIYRPSELQEILKAETGIYLSLQSISALINGKPHALRFQTIQALCNALNCKLSEFCDVLPDTAEAKQKRRKAVGETPRRLYGKREGTEEREAFPDPHKFIDYED